MRIGILGSGLMGGKLGTLFARAGHEVVFSYARSRRKLPRLARNAGRRAHAGSPADAVRDADAVLLAVHWMRVDDVLRQAGSLAGKTVITCSLPWGRCGAMIWPSGRSSPVSSKSRTPLHRRLHPCSGWCATRRADSRSADSAVGHGGWCWHIDGIFRSVVMCEMAVLSVPRLEAPFMAAPRSDKSVQSQCCPTGVNPQGFRSTASHRLMTPHPRGWFTSTGRPVRMVPDGRIRLVHMGRAAQLGSYER